jgi:hypothetical protein
MDESTINFVYQKYNFAIKVDYNGINYLMLWNPILQDIYKNKSNRMRNHNIYDDSGPLVSFLFGEFIPLIISPYELYEWSRSQWYRGQPELIYENLPWIFKLDKIIRVAEDGVRTIQC